MSSVFEPGQVLSDRYRIVQVLGEGGMGVVAAADHLLLGERVALKALLPAAAANPEVIARFQREARAAVRIQSEHVARVMDVGVLPNGLPFLVMEFLEGHDLAKELEQRGPLPIAEAVDWLLEAAIGVAAAHALGIVHRDLKPANLFLARRPNGRRVVKVLDFGIAKEMLPEGAVDLTRTTATLGSAPYMSPEQIRATRSADARTDVWSLGVVLYELLTNTWPFEGDTLFAMAAAITGDQPTLLAARRPEAPAGLGEVIAHCLKKDRDERFASLVELARALAPFGSARAPGLSDRVADLLGDAAPAVSREASVPVPTDGARAQASLTKEPWSRSAAHEGAAGRSRWLADIAALSVPLVAGAWFALRPRTSPPPVPESAPSAAGASSLTTAIAPSAAAALPTIETAPSAEPSVPPVSVAPAQSTPVAAVVSVPPRGAKRPRAAAAGSTAPLPGAAATGTPAPASPPNHGGNALIKDL